MITSAILRKTTLIVLVVLFSFPVIAQNDPNETHPMLNLLSFVPDTPEVRSAFYYADIETSVATRFGTRQYANSEEWYEFPDEQDVWQAALPHVMPIFHNNFSLMVADAGETTGINYFSIERTAWFGQDESYGLIMEGDFDTEAIVTAYKERDWELTPNDDSILVLCSNLGCEEGSVIDFTNRNTANPFGGELGRREPIALVDDYIFNAIEMDSFETMLMTRAGLHPSLGAAADVQAAVRNLNLYGSIRQAAIFNHADLIQTMLPLTIEPAARRRTLNQIQDVPVAQLLMLVDTANPFIEAGHLLLVYATQADAQIAQAALSQNLSPDSNLVLAPNGTLRQLMESRGILQPVTMIEDEMSGYFVVRVSLQNSLTIGTAHSTNGSLIPSGIQFYLFLRMVQVRDVHWFAFLHD
jgi:hypothetical protein